MIVRSHSLLKWAFCERVQKQDAFLRRQELFVMFGLHGNLILCPVAFFRFSSLGDLYTYSFPCKGSEGRCFRKDHHHENIFDYGCRRGGRLTPRCISTWWSAAFFPINSWGSRSRIESVLVEIAFQ